ncbi:MAG: DegV family protein [Chloroflexi bacterium]|nr:DegV family protein [Chloroflexota bacterium]
MSRVAIVTDSASDLMPATAAAAGIAIVPLEVSFGDVRFKAGVDLTTEQFWERMAAPDQPFPKTAAASAGDFVTILERRFAEGAESAVCIVVAGSLSGTLKAALIARDNLPEREIHVVDSGSASMGEGLLALMAVEMAARGSTAAEIAATLEDRRSDLDLYVALDTLEYLKRGGRISGTQAAVGTLLSVKPIITIRAGAVDTADKVRTRSKARERVLELLTTRPVERVAILHTMAEDVQGFRDELVRRMPGGIDPAAVSIQPVGPSIGPHLGPGGIGAVVLYAR